ncbi:MAG: beta-carotene hydroxylase [Cyanobacteria bacterium P01_A01_bin.17]
MTAALKPRTIPPEFLLPPETFGPTIWIFVTATALLVCGTLGQFVWDWPGWCSFLCSIVALHLAGTIIHEASHNAAHTSRIINAALGHASALMLGFAFPVFTRVHLQHHANVNDPDKDPDHFVSTGGPLWLIAARFFYHEIFFFQRRLWRKYELLEWFLSRLYLVALIGCAIQFGFIHFVLNFWFVPALIVGITYGLFFDYFPHRPFQETARWRNARIYASPILNVLILSQNYHLIHHLWPSIPWYRIQPSYFAVKHLLDERESPQTFGVFDDRKNFMGFLYDIFVGVQIENIEQPLESEETMSPEPASEDVQRESKELEPVLVAAKAKVS